MVRWGHPLFETHLKRASGSPSKARPASPSDPPNGALGSSQIQSYCAAALRLPGFERFLTGSQEETQGGKAQ